MLELSKRIAGNRDLKDLGIKGLELPGYEIKAALRNKGEIQEATYHVLSRWLEKQKSREEAYINLIAGLRKCEVNQLAGELEQWVETAPRRSSAHVVR